MATATMATAAGAAALLYYTLNRKLHSNASQEEDTESSVEVGIQAPLGIERISHKLVQAPATWFETISTLSETLKFTYSETLGKWPIGDLAFGINFLLKRQGNLQVGNVFGGKDSVQLMGPEIISELRYLLTLLTLCWHFSKKPFSLFLEEVGCSVENVILQKPKAGILKPAFTIIIDHKTRCFLLLIRGTHSVKDTLTAATGAVVPFHHSVVREGGVSDLVLGYAHCGMVAAARWIAKLSTPCLSKALGEHPGYTIKIIGHSLGGGTATLLTYILREQKDFTTTTCVAFAPAACMSWELAESGTDFITSVINGADLVPTFSAASVDDLRAEVTASAWLNDLRNQIERTRILRSFYRSASALGSRLPSIATAKATVAGAGAILRPVSSGTQVVMKRAHGMAQAAWAHPGLNFSTWSCMRPRHRANPSKPDDSADLLSASYKTTTTTTVISETQPSTSLASEWSAEIEYFASADPTEAGAEIMENNGNEEGMTEAELWQQLEQGLYSNQGGDESTVTEVEAVTAAEMGARIVSDEAGSSTGGGSVSEKEVHRFYPPGKIIHVVTLLSGETEEGVVGPETRSGVFLTRRLLYSKLRLSQTMISDHFMPAYQRQMERAVAELELETHTLVVPVSAAN